MFLKSSNNFTANWCHFNYSDEILAPKWENKPQCQILSYLHEDLLHHLVLWDVVKPPVSQFLLTELKSCQAILSNPSAHWPRLHLLLSNTKVHFKCVLHCKVQVTTSVIKKDKLESSFSIENVVQWWHQMKFIVRFFSVKTIFLICSVLWWQHNIFTQSWNSLGQFTWEIYASVLLSMLYWHVWSS